MYQLCRSVQPKIPENALEVSSIAIEFDFSLKDSESSSFFRQTASTNSSDLAIIILPQQMEDALPHIGSAHVDGTLKLVSNQFTQLLAILRDCKGNALPLFFVLMTNRIQAL